MSSRVLKFSKLIKVSVDDSEIVNLEQAIQNIVEMSNSLSKIDTSGVSPLFCTLEDEYSSCFHLSTESSLSGSGIACDVDPFCVDDLFVNCASSAGNLFSAPLIINKSK